MICIHICSKGEWRALKDILKVQDEHIDTYPFGEFIRYGFNDRECIFYHSGATKTKSSAACQYAIDNWKPDIIMVLGTCGGVDERLRVLDVVIASRTAQYDCIDRMGNERHIFYEQMITNIDNSWLDFSEFKGKVYEGLIATADQDINYEVLQMLRKEDVMCADWESGAVAHICHLNKVRSCIVRGISDIPIENVRESEVSQANDYRYNTPKVMKKLIEDILPVLINRICKI